MVESPCVGICVVDEADICEGCGRNLDEIAGWMAMDDAERAAAVERAARRVAGLDLDQEEN